jgi:hypothetical protein
MATAIIALHASTRPVVTGETRPANSYIRHLSRTRPRIAAGRRGQIPDHGQDRRHAAGTLRLASASPSWSITAARERLLCTSIPT